MSVLQSASGLTSCTLTGVVAGNSLVAFPFNPASNGFNDQIVSDNQDNLWQQHHQGNQSNRRLELWTAVNVAGGDYVVSNTGSGGGRQIVVYEVEAAELATTSFLATNFDSTTVKCANSITVTGSLIAVSAGLIRFDSNPSPGSGWTGLDNISWLYTQCRDFPAGMIADDCEFSISEARWSMGTTAVLRISAADDVKKRRRFIQIPEGM